MVVNDPFVLPASVPVSSLHAGDAFIMADGKRCLMTNIGPINLADCAGLTIAGATPVYKRSVAEITLADPVAAPVAP